MPNIKPCPFCGGEVVIDDPEAHLRGVGYCIECDPCNLSMWSFAGEKPDSLIGRWNCCVSKKGPSMEKYRVYISQVNQTYIDVEAKDEAAAASKAEIVWKREYAEPSVMSVEKLNAF